MAKEIGNTSTPKKRPSNRGGDHQAHKRAGKSVQKWIDNPKRSTSKSRERMRDDG